MTKRTLSENAKQFLNFEDNTLNTPISFGEKPVPSPKSVQSVGSPKYDKIPSVVWEAIRSMENAEKIDPDGFATFLESKSSNMNVKTDNDIFDKRSFDADMKDLERRYNEETAWLKINTPKSPDEMSNWSKRLQARDNLRRLLPREEDPKYHSKEIISVTKSGHDCKVTLERFRDEWKKISKSYDDKVLNEHIETHKITMNEDDFKILKTLHRLGQLNVDKIPTNEIRTSCSWTTARNDFEQALWNFETVADYNESLKTKNISRQTDPNETAEKLAFMNYDIEMAARAILCYATEFMALADADRLDKPFI